MNRPRTLFDKIWERHAIHAIDGETLLYVDRCLIHEGSRQAFDMLERHGLGVRRPRQVLACADHYVPTQDRERPLAEVVAADVRAMIERLDREAARHGFGVFGLGHPDQGILHVVGPERGLTLPGMVIGGGDSHTSTHGAFGALAFGIGNAEVAHVLATQTVWERRPGAFLVRVDGILPPGVSAKDLILSVVARLGAGATGHVIEYAGQAVSALSMEERMTVCNMSVEAGARAGLIAPDDTTFAYLEGRPAAPCGAFWERALDDWRGLPTDPGASFARTLVVDAAAVAPMVTWGTVPAQAVPITGRVPDPDGAAAPEGRAEIAAALDYMGLEPRMPLAGIPVDIVFIGSCTNARIEDLRAAAEVARRGRSVVPAWVVPGSAAVKRQAEAEGLDGVFKAAGFEWRDPGCSLCTAINGVDMLKPGQRCAATSNRNYRGRQGPGARTHLMSPAMAAAAALTGRLTDVREWGEGCRRLSA